MASSDPVDGLSAALADASTAPTSDQLAESSVREFMSIPLITCCRNRN
jgi:hypothetical protein